MLQLYFEKYRKYRKVGMFGKVEGISLIIFYSERFKQ